MWPSPAEWSLLPLLLEARAPELEPETWIEAWEHQERPVLEVPLKEWSWRLLEERVWARLVPEAWELPGQMALEVQRSDEVHLAEEPQVQAQ